MHVRAGHLTPDIYNLDAGVSLVVPQRNENTRLLEESGKKCMGYWGGWGPPTPISVREVVTCYR